jgi:hypothetical protein
LATLADPPVVKRAHITGRTRFYFWLSLAYLALGVVGFAPTYWLQIPAGTFTGSPLMHIHAVVFTGWLLLLVGQNWRIAQGRLAHHKAWGLVGIALATLMLAIGYLTSILGLSVRLADGAGDDARAFLIVGLFAITMFYVFFIAAMANIRRPEWHKRLIFVATAFPLGAAVARFFFLYRRGYGPDIRPETFPSIPVAATFTAILLVGLIFVAGMIFDWRTRGRPHPAWVIGLVVLVVGGKLREPLSATPAWLSFADWTTRIAG